MSVSAFLGSMSFIRSGISSTITYARPPIPGAMMRINTQYIFLPVRSTCTIRPICSR